ncbi:unnamed protein product, partial [Amoebophrya sp. A25]|eukprot:GSA25T00004403001.1
MEVDTTAGKADTTMLDTSSTVLSGAATGVPNDDTSAVDREADKGDSATGQGQENSPSTNSAAPGHAETAAKRLARGDSEPMNTPGRTQEFLQAEPETAQMAEAPKKII